MDKRDSKKPLSSSQRDTNLDTQEKHVVTHQDDDIKEMSKIVEEMKRIAMKGIEA